MSSTPSPTGTPPQGTRRGFPKSLILPGILAVAAIVFIAMNRQDVSIWLIARITMPIWAAFTVIALVGLFVGFMLGRRTKAKPGKNL